MSSRAPLLIIVSGAPGSGKTTLAHAIAEYMRLPHVERDVILKSIEYTSQQPIDRGGTGVPVYYKILADMLECGVSLVTDGTLYKNISEQDIKTILKPHAHIVNIHVRALDVHKRFYDREMHRIGSPNDWVEVHMKHPATIHPLTVEPLDLGVQCIEVDATSTYKPSMERIVDIISHSYEQNRIHRKEKI